MADKDLNEKMAEERKYYLGKTDIVPGTKMTVAEAKAKHQKEVAAENARMEKRRNDWLKKREANAPAEQPADATPVDSAQTPHTKESLLALGKDDLVAMAKEAGIETVPDNMTKGQIADLILAK